MLPLRFLANPHCEERMKLLLKQKQDNMEVPNKGEEGEEKDEISFSTIGKTSAHAVKTQCVRATNAFAF